MIKPLTKLTRRPDITFRPDGSIDIVSRLADSLALRPGDVIDIAADDRSGEYYLFVRYRNPPGNHFGRVYSPGRGKYMRCRSRLLTGIILRACGAPKGQSARFYTGYPVEQEGTVYIPIITSCRL